jgi:hypothetical protein
VRHDLLAIPAQRLAGAQPEARPGPAPAVEPELQLGERLGPVLRGDPVLVDVGGDVALADPAGAVAGRRVRAATSSSLNGRIERSTSTLPPNTTRRPITPESVPA